MDADRHSRRADRRAPARPGKLISDLDVPDGEGVEMDTADYSASDAGVRINLAATHRGQRMPSAEGDHAEGDELAGIENLTGSAYADWLQGDENRNVLKAGDGDDWDDPATTTVTEGGVFGRRGHDMLAGMDGNDWLNGGDGRDDIGGHAGDDMLIGGPDEDAPYSVSAAGGTVAILTGAAAIAAFDTTQVMIAQDDGSTHWRGGLLGGAGNDTLGVLLAELPPRRRGARHGRAAHDPRRRQPRDRPGQGVHSPRTTRTAGRRGPGD